MWRVNDAGQWFAHIPIAERRRLRAVAEVKRDKPLKSIPAINTGLNLWPELKEGENSAIFKFCQAMRG